MMNKKQDRLERLAALCVGLGFLVAAYLNRHHSGN
jgi:hypothetical protein